MQNIDYARVIHRKPSSAREQHLPVRTEHKSGFILFTGAIFIFTAGIFVGMGIEKRESQYKGKTVSFRNFGKENPKDGKTASKKDNSPGNDAGIQYPPREGQINYVIFVGDYGAAQAGAVGKDIIHKMSSMQGRIFKTSSGKLYIGYFYQKNEAEAALKNLTTAGIKDVSGPELKSLRF